MNVGGDEFTAARLAHRYAQVGGVLFGAAKLICVVFDLVSPLFIGRNFAELFLASQVPVERAHHHPGSRPAVRILHLPLRQELRLRGIIERAQIFERFIEGASRRRVHFAGGLQMLLGLEQSDQRQSAVIAEDLSPAFAGQRAQEFLPDRRIIDLQSVFIYQEAERVL
ncbi:MAG TPA: hypothetical protein VFV58_06845 [Blastocatellia bacterium]|nr:hypothetical protein [Blastocatellia bacterium]